MDDRLLNRFRYALCNGKTVIIDDVTKESRKSSKFTCIGCGHEMVAVLGDIREHHYRHKNNENCSHETYLHNLAKKRIKELFDSEDSFLIYYKAKNSCNLYGACKLHRCQSTFGQIIDLKKFFDTCELEKICGNFRPDVLLTHSEFPNRRLFIEIHVSNPCSPEKLASGVKIIEIDVSNEDTVIYPFDERCSNIHFYNFKFRRDVLPSKKVERFSLLVNEDNSIVFNIDFIDCSDQDNHIDNAEFDIVLKKAHDKIRLEYLGLAQAMILGKTIRHCVFCENCYRCSIPIPQKVIEKSSGKEILIQEHISPLKLPESSQWAYAKKCCHFVPNRRGCHRLIKDYGSTNYILWDSQTK